MKKLIILTIATLFITATFAQQQEERIIRFHSDIKMETDGRIEVAEHIRVYAGGNEIKRGIVRELPLYRKNDKGKRIPMDYRILSVQCDGADTKYHTERSSDKLEVYIGDAEALLRAGEYDYTIAYESYGHIGFYDDFDELYWNVTGTEWIFPIEQASAAITLPGAAKAIQTNFYTGVKGATGKDCRVDDRGNIQVFTSTRKLAPREGLTVAVGFPRDIIDRPPPPSKAEALWYEHTYGICGWTGTVICLLFFFITLNTAGKRPKRQVVIPTFRPPRDLSPAAVNFLAHRRIFSTAFTATLVEMAVKGVLSIRCEKKKYWLVNKMNTEGLRSEEQKIHAAIFPEKKAKDSEIIEQLRAAAESNPELKANLNIEELQKELSEPEVEVSISNNEKFRKANGALETEIYKQFKFEDHYRDNSKYVPIGGLLLNMVFALYLILTGWTGEVGLAFVFASPFIFMEILVLLTAFKKLTFGRTHFLLASFITLIILYLVILFSGDMTVDHLPSFVFFTVFSLLYIVYVVRIRRVFTPEGAKINSELKGFKMYLQTAEEHRLNMLTPPELTPELFEKLLPYAIALKVSNEWCKKFDNVLKTFDYHPQWYDSSESLSTVGFATSFESLGKTFDSSVFAAKREPVSDDSSSSGSSDWSSGSSGGGYSGGGGGGGGVRGC